MKIRVGRWFVALAVRFPGAAEPTCLGFGLEGSKARAWVEAVRLARTL